MRVQCLGREDSLEERLTTHSSILAWKIHSTQGRKESDRTEHTCAVASSVQFSSVAPSCPTLCDPMDCSTLGLPVHHQLLELAQTHIHRVNDAIQPSHRLPSPSPPAFSLSQRQGLFQ